MSSSSERSNQAVALRNDNSKVIAKLSENVKINRKPINVLDEDTFIKVIILFLNELITNICISLIWLFKLTEIRRYNRKRLFSWFGKTKNTTGILRSS